MSRIARRRGLIVGILTAASALFVFAKAYPERLVPLSNLEALILVGFGVVGIIVSLAGIRPAVLVLGVLAVVGGLAKLVTGSALVGGGVAVGSLLVGLGIVFIAIAVADGAPKRTQAN